MVDNFWEDSTSEVENFKLGAGYPPVQVFLTMIDIAKLNSLHSIFKPVILSDGKELDVELKLETDRDQFSKDLRKVLDEAETKNSS